MAGSAHKRKLFLDATTPANGDQVNAILGDSAGNLVGVTSNALDVNIAGSTGLGIFAEDTVAGDGDLGQHVLVVRKDTKASTAGTDGDYASLIQDADGDLYVSDTVAQGSLSTLAGAISGSEMQVDIVTMPGQYAEDAAHSSGETGNFMLAVANHTEGALHSADGDYAALQVDSSGRLRVISDLDVQGLPSGTAGEVTKETIGATAVEIVATPLANRKQVHIQNISNNPLYFGYTSGVTVSGATQGWEIPKFGEIFRDLDSTVDMWLIAGSAGNECIVEEIAG